MTVLETRVNSDGRMRVKYLHSSGLVEMDPADVFVHLYLYVKDQDLGIKGDEVQRMASTTRRMWRKSWLMWR